MTGEGGVALHCNSWKELRPGRRGMLWGSQSVTLCARGKETHRGGSGAGKMIPQPPEFRNCPRSISNKKIGKQSKNSDLQPGGLALSPRSSLPPPRTRPSGPIWEPATTWVFRSRAEWEQPCVGPQGACLQRSHPEKSRAKRWAETRKQV